RLSIPPTLLVSAIARVEDVGDCISSELKQADNAIYMLVAGEQSLTGSHWQELYGDGDEKLPSLDLEAAPVLYGKLHQAIKEGLVTAAHDLSEGGLAVALAEMVIGSECGAEIRLDALAEREHRDDQNFLLFAEGPGRILVEIRKDKKEQFEQLFGKDQVLLGRVTAESRFKAGLSGKEVIDTARENLTGAWRKGLPFN
ncbi:MAG: phosphoribosylformylglycinamidine synthase subunit PurL, partial [Cyanobacteria bacterium HKST-UBA01]|nr:phosphoribosylformylglycinamidine synthase subunit PurL [Cyanobacteria bacterium HKST-UBA01]